MVYEWNMCEVDWFFLREWSIMFLKECKLLVDCSFFYVLFFVDNDCNMYMCIVVKKIYNFVIIFICLKDKGWYIIKYVFWWWNNVVYIYFF